MGHPKFFTSYEVVLYARRVPSFFETFPIVLLDEEGIVRATQPFRRAESKYALERSGLKVNLSGGAMNGLELSSSLAVQAIVRRSIFGELLDFDRIRSHADGVFRTSPRAWFTFSHLLLSCLFLFGHWWHAGRTLYRDLLSGIVGDATVTFGCYSKVGDVTTISSYETS